SAARYQNLSLNTLKLAGQCGKLKCCLNYELDSYMDALKDIPNNIERIETQRGVAYLQKTDIFKKLMWFSYPGEENWIPLTTDRVKEVHALNKEGVKPAEIGAVVLDAPEEKPATYDYENVVGQDRLTRLDERNKKKRRQGKHRRKSATMGKTAKQSSSQKEAKPAETKEKNTEAKASKPKRRFRGNNRKGKGAGPQQPGQTS